MSFTVHNKDTAPAASKSVLDDTAKVYGFVPNLYGVFAESPLAVSAYLQLSGLIKDRASLTPQEQQIVMIAVSVANGCDYCVAAHSVVGAMARVPADTIQALREGRAPADSKTAALAAFVRSVVSHRGWVPAADLQAFLDAGYTRSHVLDVLTINALKTLSNYTNHLAGTPLDHAFAPQRWVKPAAA
ncbi:MAG TPA: carboxymuconolactone decarboxylase family protein [Opitutaceae bacterium]